MKYHTDKSTNRTLATAETEAERKALEYLSRHRPFFAVAEEYMITAFIAGWNAAIEAETKAGLAAIRNQKR